MDQTLPRNGFCCHAALLSFLVSSLYILWVDPWTTELSQRNSICLTLIQMVRSKRASEFLNADCSKRSEVLKNVKTILANFREFKFDYSFNRLQKDATNIISNLYQKLSENRRRNSSTLSRILFAHVTTARSFLAIT
jgi:hypothetical protein